MQALLKRRVVCQPGLAGQVPGSHHRRVLPACAFGQCGGPGDCHQELQGGDGDEGQQGEQWQGLQHLDIVVSNFSTYNFLFV